MLQLVDVRGPIVRPARPCEGGQYLTEIFTFQRALLFLHRVPTQFQP